jgi:para-nitrobenzyl esterase
MVRTGTPAAGQLTDWPPYEPASRCTAVFDAVSRVVSDPWAERRRAWDG